MTRPKPLDREYRNTMRRLDREQEKAEARTAADYRYWLELLGREGKWAAMPAKPRRRGGGGV